MARSSNSISQAISLSETQEQPERLVWAWLKLFASKKLVLAAGLIILALGYAHLTHQSFFRTLTWTPERQYREIIIGYEPEELYASYPYSPSRRAIAHVLAFSELLPWPNLATPIAQLNSKPNLIPEPVPTRAFNALALGPLPSPVAERLPEAISPAIFNEITDVWIKPVRFKQAPTAAPPVAAEAPPLPLPATPEALTTLPPVPASPEEIAQPGIKHIVLISIDGLRPDALFAAEAPNLDDLITQGSYCPKAQTLKTSITLPSHASMISGMIEEKHGILWNAPYIGWPGMNGPTLFNVAHDAGFSTAMVFGKQKMNYMVLGDSVDKLFGEDVHDPEVRDHALEFIEEGLTDVLFIHFPDVDRVGHAYGWMSPYQFDAIRFVDGLIGEVVAKLEQEGYLANTLLIITADHGGHGFGHGDDAPEDRTIPWLAVGPGVPAGVTLHREINTYDTAATILYALDLPIPEKWDGQPILDIFQ